MTEAYLNSTTNLPVGTLTFLFTDVEGSTRLWELYPEGMRAAMARHDELIESSVTQFGGKIVRPRGEGDSRFAVFTRATDAITAALAIQRQLTIESWLIPYPLRVRMALHTGEADLRDGDYYGTAVNRCARLRNVAYGGQILISQTTRYLAEEMPDGAGLRDLGEHTLKDLKRTEHIYQLVSAGLPTDFPPLKTQDSSLTNLPVSLTSFIGRQDEMAVVQGTLMRGRLLTITGPGGSGKTRLVLQVAEDLIASFPDGVWFVDLTPLSNPDLVIQYIMENMGIREEVGSSPIQTLVDSIRDKNLLLILDNCEHVLTGVVPLMKILLRGTSRLRILTTSRETLGVVGEKVWSIPPLSTPKLDREPLLEDMLQYEAVKLFVERAAAVRAGFTLSRENAPAVAQICTRLEGIPLAIELAAARARVLSVSEIAGRLDDRFRLLIGNQSEIPRHKTLRSLIDWSYDLLPENERTLFRRLSVFMGGWTLQAAEEVCSGGSFEPIEVLDLLAHLVDKSLVIMEIQEDGNRYRFLDTIHRYAQERLDESAEVDQFTGRYANYFAKLAQDSYPEQWGSSQSYTFKRLEAEHDNLRAAMDWLALEDVGEDLLLRMTGSLWHFWEVRGYISEGRARLDHALDRTPHAPPQVRANGLRGAGMLARQQGDYEQAKAMHRESLALYGEIGDKFGIGRELDVLGEIEQYQGNYDQAIELHNESLVIRHEIDDKEGVAISLGQLGIIARDHGEYQKARELLEESLKLCRALGDPRLTAQTLYNLGLVEHPLCEYETASHLFEEAVALYRDLNDKLGISNTLQNLGNVARDHGDFNHAKAIYNECLAIKNEIGDKRGIAQTLVNLAETAFYQGNYPIAAELAEKSLTIFKALGVKRGINHAMEIKALVGVYQGDYDLAHSLAIESVTLSAEINSPRAIGYSKAILGLVAYAKGNLNESSELLLEARRIFRDYSDSRSLALTLVNLARTAYRKDDHESARQFLEESMLISDDLKTNWVTSLALEISGLLQRSEGHYERSYELFQESLRGSIEQDNQQGIANCLGALAGLAVVTNQFAHATRLFAAAEKIRQAIGAKMGHGDRDEYEYYLTLLRDQMGTNAFETAWSEGYLMTLQQFDFGTFASSLDLKSKPAMISRQFNHGGYKISELNTQ